MSRGAVPAGLCVSYTAHVGLITKNFPHCTSNHSADKGGLFSGYEKKIIMRDTQKKLMRFFLYYTSRGRGRLSSNVIRQELNWDCCFAVLSIYML